MRSLRVFVAVAARGAVRQAIVSLQARFADVSQTSNVRWTNPEQLHLTLRFLGNVPREQIGELGTALHRACIGVKKFEIDIEELICFPTPQRPRIIWASVAKGAAPLTALAERVRAETTGFGDSADSKPFVPHLTIGRSKATGTTGHRLSDLIGHENPIRFGTLAVSEVLLLSSERAGDGSRYSLLGSETLA